MAILSEILIGMASGLFIAVPATLAFGWMLQARGAAPQPYPSSAGRQTRWPLIAVAVPLRRPGAAELQRAS